MSYQSGWESFRLSAVAAPDAAPTAFLGGRIQHPELTDVNFQTDSESIPDNFVGDETVEVDRQGFESPKPPPKGWTQLEEVVTAYREAADACNHRFIVCCCTSGHVSKKLGSVKVTECGPRRIGRPFLCAANASCHRKLVLARCLQNACAQK